jgi:general secretion pathway protein L
MTAASLFSHSRLSARRFLSWWSSELSDLVAAATASGPRAWRIMFLRCERGCDVYLRTGDRIELIGTSNPASDQPLAELRRRLGAHKITPAQIVLRLQPSEVVQARLSVPAAAGGMLEPILCNQIERLAPWPADKAVFAYEVAATADGGTLDVALAVAGRSVVEGLVTELDNFGLAPGVVDYGTDASGEPRMNLLGERADENRRSGRQLLSSVGFLCLASLLAAAFGIAGLVHQTRERAALEPRLEELRSRSAAELPNQARLRRQAWLAAEKLAQPSMAIMLEALSRALPDDAWLNRLEVEQGVVRMAGHAANAAKLVGQIQASGHFADVQFSAPTTLTEGESHESFTITARIVPGRKLN